MLMIRATLKLRTREIFTFQTVVSGPFLDGVQSAITIDVVSALSVGLALDGAHNVVWDSGGCLALTLRR